MTVKQLIEVMDAVLEAYKDIAIKMGYSFHTPDSSLSGTLYFNVEGMSTLITFYVVENITVGWYQNPYSNNVMAPYFKENVIGQVLLRYPLDKKQNIGDYIQQNSTTQPLELL